MRASILAVALMVLATPFAVASAPQSAPLTTLQAIHLLTNEQASLHVPVNFEATVTFYRSYEGTLFVQDGDLAIYVQPPRGTELALGDHVSIHGVTQGSFRPFVAADKVTVLVHGKPLQPVTATFDDLIHARLDCRLVKLSGRVLSAGISVSSDHPGTTLELLLDGGTVEVQIENDDASLLPGLLDEEVEVTGAASGRFDGKMQMTGIVLHTQSLAGLKVVKAPPAPPWTTPLTPMNEIVSEFRQSNQSRRVRVEGTITYYMPGSAVVLQNGSRSLWVNTLMRDGLQVGDRADATGFPDVRDGFLRLADGEVRDNQVSAPVTPLAASWTDLAQSHHVFDLVSIEGRVVAKVREAAQDEYVLENGGHLFSAVLRHPGRGSAAPAPQTGMKEIPEGSSVRVEGVCILEDSNPFNANVPFDILLRTTDDITVIAKPSWLSVPHLTRIVIGLLLVIFVFGARVMWTERRARRHNAHLAYLERRRGRILEDINNSKPLAEILERITELESARLNGAPCWCKVADGATLGSCPGEEFQARLRVAEREIPGRSGGALGYMYAAFHASSKPGREEEAALKLATDLATLAIETSRLYSDLVHRSEFDLLTDIHNRFSLDKHLESLIESARQSAGIFGVLYVDLNDFKLVNDQYGHHTGDLYLQEVAIRMKRQLRPGDVLARLGGDEFAVVMRVHSRADVDVIIRRLDRCLEQPFSFEGQTITGSASIGIAMYPADGATRDSLLNAADAAMYVAKQTKPHEGEMHSGQAVS